MKDGRMSKADAMGAYSSNIHLDSLQSLEPQAITDRP